mgnify:CR=1 FL=1
MWAKAFFRRLAALTRKEFYQLLRDKSSMLLGIVMPVVLILLIGYGMSLDVKNVPVAVVLEDHSPTARQAVSFVTGSEYFSPVYVQSMQEAQSRLLAHDVDAILCVPLQFTSDLAKGSAQVQVIVNGVEATTASSAQTYIESGLLSWAARQGLGAAGGQVSVVSRIWFNDANTSTWFFVPGIIMMVLLIVGVFLTSVVMAREWERGTFESLFVTPTGVLELILAKMIPYFCVAMFGMLLCLLAGLESPTSGALLAGTTPLAEIQDDTRMMFQDARLLPWKTVIDNVGLGLKGHWRNAARDALAAVGLENRAQEWPAALSGGQKQRVALAQIGRASCRERVSSPV